MTKQLHLLLLLVFALLQCVAPLVHAHVEVGDAGLHAAGLDAPHPSLIEGKSAECFIDAADSPAIGIADQLQRNDSTVFLPAAAGLQSPKFQAVTVVKIPPSVATLATAFSPYQKPHQQAPPIFC